MRENMAYLTDTELENMVRELERDDLVPAPPDLQNQILEILDMEERRCREKVIAFKRYRFRVMTTVAAAVLVVLLLPRLENLRQRERDFMKPMQKQEYVIQSRYETKEEALRDNRMLETLFGNVNIFADHSRFNLFK